jgi:hypothetical protein
LDRDFNPETNTEVTLLGEMATQSRDGGVKSEIYNAENNALVNIQGLNELIDQSLKALATADESKSTAATSAQVGCADYPNWRVQRFGDANKKAKAKSPSSSSLSNWFPNIWLNGK